MTKIRGGGQMEQMLETQPSREGHFHSGGPPTKCLRGECFGGGYFYAHNLSPCQRHK